MILPIELIHKILLFRPRHPVAQMLKDEKERVDRLIDAIICGVADTESKPVIVPYYFKFWINNNENDQIKKEWHYEMIANWDLSTRYNQAIRKGVFYLEPSFIPLDFSLSNL
jgi:hypothetical protein